MITEILTTEAEDFKHTINEAVRLLAAGEVVAVPTETVYGLAADALNADAVAKIFAAKERPSFDPLIVHIPHKKDIDVVADIPEDVEVLVKRLIERFWPGPLTIILPKKACIPDIVTAGLPTVAVRASSNLAFNRISRTFDRPLAAPSANRFGSISPTSASAVKAELDGRIPLIVDGGACMFGLESTIIKVQAASPKNLIIILRPGPITPDDLKVYGKPVFLKDLKDMEKPEAPGLLESHYAPKTPLRVLDSPKDFIPEEGKRYALLSYRGDPNDGYTDLTDWVQMQILSPGKGKMPEAAVRFFYVLRELDKLGVDEIISEPIPERGLGIAIADRLRRAAAKRGI